VTKGQRVTALLALKLGLVDAVKKTTALTASSSYCCLKGFAGLAPLCREICAGKYMQGNICREIYAGKYMQGNICREIYAREP
jgi:hypothetical protein